MLNIDSHLKLKNLREKYFLESKEKQVQLLKNIEKENKNCIENSETRMNLANDSYFLLENELKKVKIQLLKD